jgi:uncharacterized OB-fold protein
LSATEANLSPATKFIHIAPSGRAHIQGFRCGQCNAAFLQETIACAKCGSREGLKPFEAASTGKVHTYSIVHRSYPGVKTPFISAIVDLDDGLVLKGNVEGVPAEPSDKLFGLPVRLAFKPLDQTDKSGAPYVIYYFEAA